MAIRNKSTTDVSVTGWTPKTAAVQHGTLWDLWRLESRALFGALGGR